MFHRWLGAGDIICTFPAALKIKERHPDGLFIYNCAPDFSCLAVMAGAASITTSANIAPLKKYWPYLFEAIYEFRIAENGKDYYASDEFPIEVFSVQHGIPPLREHPRLVVPEEIARRVSSLFEKYSVRRDEPVVLFHTGPTWPVRELPHSTWSDVIEKLRAVGYRNIIQLGASRNAFLGDVPVEAISGVLSMVDKLSLEETIGMIAQSSLLIGIDSGLLHMATSVGTPSVGVWGPTTPDRRFSEGANHYPVVSKVECQGCHHRLPCLHWITGCPYEIRCMKSISAQAIVDVVLSKLPPPTLSR